MARSTCGWASGVGKQHSKIQFVVCVTNGWHKRCLNMDTVVIAYIVESFDLHFVCLVLKSNH